MAILVGWPFHREPEYSLVRVSKVAVSRRPVAGYLAGQCENVQSTYSTTTTLQSIINLDIILYQSGIDIKGVLYHLNQPLHQIPSLGSALSVLSDLKTQDSSQAAPPSHIRCHRTEMGRRKPQSRSDIPVAPMCFLERGRKNPNSISSSLTSLTTPNPKDQNSSISQSSPNHASYISRVSSHSHSILGSSHRGLFRRSGESQIHAKLCFPHPQRKVEDRRNRKSIGISIPEHHIGLDILLLWLEGMQRR